MRKLLISFLCLFCLSSFAFAQEDDKDREIEALKKQLQQVLEIQAQYEQTVKILQSRLEKLERQQSVQQVQVVPEDQIREEVRQIVAEERASLPSDSAAFKPIGTSTVKLMDISFDSLFTAGGSSARESEIDLLQAGAHDPKKRGFTTQNLEFSLLGAVDPYLNGEAHLIFQIDKDGESKLEVEEAFLTTQSLPYGFQAKAGTFFTEFGRLNPQHPHSWAFVDQPVVNSRMFGGDGLRGPGARLSWLSPLPWYSEFQGGVQNANGETAYSFLNAAGEEFAGLTLIDRDVRSAEDLLYSARWLNSFDLSDEITMNLGVSGLTGPNAGGTDTRTDIYGTDIYVKWKPLANENGFPFVSWQSELMMRDYEAGEDKDNLNDWGLYSQLLWGFKKDWVASVRYDLADGDGEAAGSLRDRRRRVSPNLTWYSTEFSKLRLQYNYDKAEHIGGNDGDEHSIWLQYEFMLGSHPKHKF
jgi:hypothetical protein